MDKKKWSILVTVLLVLGVASWVFAENQEGTGGNGVPEFTQSFASKQIYPGETWNIYLNASDPDGNMKYLFAVVEQPGVGTYPVSIIRIREKNQKEFSGHLYLNTSPGAYELNFTTLTLTIHIRDKKGNFSNPVVFPLEIQSRNYQEKPPSGVFRDETLGPIMVKLRSNSHEGGGSSSIILNN